MHEDHRMRISTSLLVAGVALSLVSGCSRNDAAAAHRSSYPGAVAVDVSRIRFDDGDTFYVDHEPIRVLGIDTPEIRHPGVGIFEDQAFGMEAAESTQAWITRARIVEIATDGRDRYHRQLAHVFVDGELLAERLLKSGLAYETVSHYGDDGFPELADRILRAAARGPKPRFEPPYRWRREHQQRVPAGADSSGHS